MKKFISIFAIATAAIFSTSNVQAQESGKCPIVYSLTYSGGNVFNSNMFTNNCAFDLGYRFSDAFVLSARYEGSLILSPNNKGVNTYDQGSTLGGAAWLNVCSWDWADLEIVGVGGTAISNTPWKPSYASATVNLVSRPISMNRALSLGLGVRRDMFNAKSKYDDYTSLNIVFGWHW